MSSDIRSQASHQIKSPIGLYGKLPAHGDFIERNLSRAFIDAWDNWLQQSILSSQSQLNENWLNTYMTSPIWRFALSSGCLDQHPWLGIILPSVDSVGRYFPLTLAAKLPANTPLMQALEDHQAWFETIETIALACLSEQPNIDEVMEVLAQHPLICDRIAAKSLRDIEAPTNKHADPLDDPLYQSLIANSVDASTLDLTSASTFECHDFLHPSSLDDTHAFSSLEPKPTKALEINSHHSNDWAVTESIITESKNQNEHQGNQTYQKLTEHMVDTLLMQKNPSYSIWKTKGSDIVNQSLLCASFLPQPNYFFAMMNGTWEQVGAS